MKTKTSEQYIIDLQRKNREQGGTGTIYAVAKMLGMSQSRVGSYSRGTATFDDEMCFKTAFALGLNPTEVIAAANAERARTPEKAHFWEDVLRKVSGTAAVFMLAVVVLASSTLSTPATAGTQSGPALRSLVIMLSTLGYIVAWLSFCALLVRVCLSRFLMLPVAPAVTA